MTFAGIAVAAAPLVKWLSIFRPRIGAEIMMTAAGEPAPDRCSGIFIRGWPASALLLGWLAFAAPAPADDFAASAVAKSQNAIGQTLPDLALTGADGKSITLAQFRGKPLLVSLIYTGCGNVCPLVIENLGAASRVAEATFGEGSFHILTVGFDTKRDTPDRMRNFAKAHRSGGDNWIFAAADASTLERLTGAVGFDFAASAGGYDHPAQVTVIDQDGRVYSQIYGGSFAPPAIVEPLKSLIYRGARPLFSLTGLSDRVKLICTVYDARTGRYYFDYSLILSVLTGIVFFAGTLHFLVHELRKSLRAGRV